ncbi:Guanine nucleotide exchange factor for Cdc42p [Elasticomyces elasticus]|nr:Guanine nucleotide exchange factor for Cdc42p [Elasticomyces elasticus]
MNKVADKETSLFQICVNLRQRLMGVPGFAEQLEQEEIEADEDTDPVTLLWRWFRQGYPLMELYNAMEPSQPLALDTSKLGKGKEGKAATFKFLGACVNELKFPTEECFIVTDLYHDDTSGFVKVARVVNRVLDILIQQGLIEDTRHVDDSADFDTSRNAKRTQRQHIVDELVKTERTYVQHLELLQDFKKLVEEKGVIPGDAIHDIFLNLDKLLDFQRRFLIRVEQINAQLEAVQNWGKLFVLYKDAFKCYEAYIANQKRCEEVVVREFDKLKEAGGSLEMRQMVESSHTLYSFLMKPFQRLSKYPLLLDQLYSKGDLSEELKADLLVGKEAATEVLTRTNEAMAREDRLDAVKELKSRVEDWKGHRIEAFGELLLYGTFTVLKSDNPTNKDLEREVSNIFLSRRADVRSGVREMSWPSVTAALEPKSPRDEGGKASAKHRRLPSLGSQRAALSVMDVQEFLHTEAGPRPDKLDLLQFLSAEDERLRIEDPEMHVLDFLQSELTGSQWLDLSPGKDVTRPTLRKSTSRLRIPLGEISGNSILGAPWRKSFGKGARIITAQPAQSSQIFWKKGAVSPLRKNRSGIFKAALHTRDISQDSNMSDWSQSLSEHTAAVLGSLVPSDGSSQRLSSASQTSTSEAGAPHSVTRVRFVTEPAPDTHSAPEATVPAHQTPLPVQTSFVKHGAPGDPSATLPTSHDASQCARKGQEPSATHFRNISSSSASTKANCSGLNEPNAQQYHVYLFESILLCCKDINPNKAKNMTTKKPALDRKGKPKLQLKGRIFMQNVTDLVSLAKPGEYQPTVSMVPEITILTRGAGSYTCQIFWKGDPGIENFIIKFTTEEAMRKWAIQVQAQRKQWKARERLSAGLKPSGTSATEFTYMQNQGVLENPYQQEEDDDDDVETVAAVTPMVPMYSEFAASRNGSSTSLRSRSTTGDSGPPFPVAGRQLPPRFPTGSMGQPGLTLRTQQLQNAVASPNERGADSYFSPTVDSPMSSRTNSSGSMYPFPRQTVITNGYHEEGHTRFTAPVMSRTVSREAPLSNPGPPNQRSITSRPSFPTGSSMHSAQGVGVAHRNRSASSPDVHNVQRRQANGTQPPIPEVPPFPTHYVHMPNINRSQTNSPNMPNGMPPRSVTQSPQLSRDRAQARYATDPQQYASTSRSVTPSLAHARTMSPPLPPSTPVPDPPSQLKVKVHAPSANQILTLVVPQNISYQSLKDRIDAKLQRSTNLSLSAGNVKLKYMDDEDFVSIQNDDDVLSAFDTWSAQTGTSVQGGLGEVELFCQK